jgi:hypothetical protein
MDEIMQIDTINVTREFWMWMKLMIWENETCK